MSFDLGECGDPNGPVCTHSGMGDNEDQCPGSEDDGWDSYHHCWDCGGRWWDDKATRCRECRAYWCPDWQGNMIFRLCEHKGREFDDPLCPPCYFKKKKYHCHEPDCEKGYATFLVKWQKRADSLISIGYAAVTKGDAEVHLEVAYARKLGADIYDYYEVDGSKLIVEENKVRTVFEGDGHVDKALEHANARVNALLADGYTFRKGDWESGIGGLIKRYRKRGKRDASPKRADTK